MKALGAAIGLLAVVVIVLLAAGVLYFGGQRVGATNEQKGRAIFAITDDYGSSGNTGSSLETTINSQAGDNSQQGIQGNVNSQIGQANVNQIGNGDVRNVLVTVNSVKVHSPNAGWITVSTSPQTVDLVQLGTRHESAVVADAQLFSDNYDQVQIEVNNIIVVSMNGTAQQALAPTSTLVFNNPVSVRANDTATVVLDVNLTNSLRYATNGQPVFVPVVVVNIYNGPVINVNSNSTTTVQIGNVNNPNGLNVPPQIVYVPVAAPSVAATTSVTVSMNQNGQMINNAPPLPQNTQITIVNNKVVINVINGGNQTVNQTNQTVNQTVNQTTNQTINQTGNQTNQTGTMHFAATLSGAAEVPSTGSAGTGHVDVWVTGYTMTLNGTFSGMMSSATASHIHTAPVNVSGPIVIPLVITSGYDTTSGTLSLGSGANSSVTLTQGQLAELQNGNMYVNVHSMSSPNGEIRGQLVSTGAIQAPPQPVSTGSGY